MKSKVELLAHYAEKSPKKFMQIDCWNLGRGRGDYFMQTDDDGHCIHWLFKEELMGGSDVRVFIPEGITCKAAADLLQKVVDSLRENQADLVYRVPEESVPPEEALKQAAELVERERRRAEDECPW